MKEPAVPVKAIDSSFSTFMFGLTIGVVGSLLLGTEEGRKITKKILHSVAEGIEENEDFFIEAKKIARDTFEQIETKFKTPDYFPNQTSEEAPPPPPPLTHRSKPTPTFFEQNGAPLKP